MPSGRECLDSNLHISQSAWTWTWPKCEWFFATLTWLAGLLSACVQWIPGFRQVSSSTPILPIINPESQTSKRKCATWRNCKRTCTSPKCRRFRCWKKNWRKLPRQFWRRLIRCKWPKWEPDQNSLWVRAIKASRLDGFKMALKEKMHFAARILYVMSYKVFTGIAIYLIIMSSIKIFKTPIIYKYAGKVPIGNIIFPGIDVCPSEMFAQDLLKESEELFTTTQRYGLAVDSFGHVWTLAQAVKLYYYVFKQCQAGRSHSHFFGLSFESQSLNLGEVLKDYSNFTLRDSLEDKDFAKIVRFVKMKGKTVDCTKMLAACRWGPHGNWNCSEIFEAVQTETGQCCRLKQINQEVLRARLEKSEGKDIKWNIDEHKFVEDTASLNEWKEKIFWYQEVAGSDHGLTFVIIMETENRGCSMNAGNAYVVYVHSALDVPQTLTNGILVEPNHEVHIDVNADIILSDKDIIDLPVDIRQCYFQVEKYLDSTTYTENNCNTQCRTLLFQEECKCHKLGTTAGRNEIICSIQHTECERRVESEIQQKGYAHMCATLQKPMKCFQGCTEVVYHTAVSSTAYFGTPGFVEALNLKDGQVTAIVRISFGLDKALALERQQQYDFWEIVGILGGILGLMIGVDFMTAIHLVYAWGIYFKGLWLKRKLANSVVVRSIVNVTSILDAVHSVSTQTPTNGRPHPMDFAKRKDFKRIVIKRKGQVAPTPAEPVNPAAELTPTNATEIPAEPSQLRNMADIVMTNELLKTLFITHKRRVRQSVDHPDSISPVPSIDLIDPVSSIIEQIDSVLPNESAAMVDRVTSADVIAVINSLASGD